MNIRANRYNNPSVGAAFESLAGMFAPMSGSDVAGYAAADLNRQQAARQAQQLALVDMFAQGEGPLDDRVGIAAGLYTPNQSWGAVQMGDATTRRGQNLTHGASIYGHDLGYRASTENNVRDNERALATNAADNRRHLQTSAMDNLLNPLKPGEQTRAVDQDVWAAMGLADMPATEEYVNSAPGGSPKLTNIQRPDGSKGYALETPLGLMDVETQEILPSDTTMFSTAAQGSAEDVGLGTATSNRIEGQLLQISQARLTANTLLPLLQQNPAALGAVGWLQGRVQDAIAAGGEVGELFGGGFREVLQDIESGVADAGLTGPNGAFNPDLPRIDFLKNLFAYQMAKTEVGERLSNQAVQQWREALGLDSGLLNNSTRGMATIDQAMSMLEARENLLLGSLGAGRIVSPGGAPAGQPAAQTAPAPAPAGPQAGEVQDGYRFLGGDPADPNSWEAVQ